MLGRGRVGSEHILLGLYLAGDGPATQALESQGISLEAVRSELPQHPAAAGRPPLGYLPYEREAKKALDLSRREALQLGHHHIGAEHILLGMIRGGESTAAQLLAELGTDLGQLREQVIELLDDDGDDGVPAPDAAVWPAGLGGQPDTGTGHSLIPAILSLVESIDCRLSAVERRVGTGPAASAQPDLPSVAEGLQRLSDEVERLRGVLRQQGIQPRGGAA